MSEETKKKILIIDDEEPIIRMYSEPLSDYNVLSAADGEAGLKVARSEKPDLIYLDIIMPKMNGLDVLKKLKESDETKEIPVILLTNLPEEASKDKAVALSAHDYFVKVNYEPDKLAEVTKEILK
jgi:two-component system, OmpR family, alkaline phosphatase synthesis response regulator PhoP